MKNKKKLLSFLLLFIIIFCFEPKLFVKISILNIIFIFGIVLSFLIICLIYIKEQKKIPCSAWIVIIFRLSFAIQTILSNGDILMWGYMSLVLVTLALTISFYSKYDLRLLINTIVNVLFCWVICNYITFIFFPNGVIDYLYFIGIRTRFTDVAFPLCVLAFVNDELNNRKTSLKTLIIVIVSIITILQMWIVTAIIGIVILCFAYFIIKYIFKKTNINLLFITFLVAICADVLVVHFDFINQFPFISEIFGKSTTLTGRTEIWAIAKEIISEKILFGYGMADNGNFVYWGFEGNALSYWQAHNQWLQLLYDGGLITTISFSALILLSSNGLKKMKNYKIKAYFISLIFVYLIMMITEIYSYTPYFYLPILLLYEGENFNFIYDMKRGKCL